MRQKENYNRIMLSCTYQNHRNPLPLLVDKPIYINTLTQGRIKKVE